MSDKDLEERKRLGRACKRILDRGRLEYIEKMLGMNARLVYYVDESISLENVLLVAECT
jgi:tRNA:m4X modification enzyme